MEEKLIEVDRSRIIDIAKKQEIYSALEGFLVNTNLEYDEGSSGLYLIEKGWFKEDIARLIIYQDRITVEVDENNYSRIRRLFNDFVNFYKIKIYIKVVSELLSYNY